MGLDDDIALFERVPFFAVLDTQALRILAIGAETKQLSSGAVLFYAGELADGGYLLQEGTLLLESGTFAEGKEVTVGPGTLIGELAMLADAVCPATAIAKGPVTVIRISRSLFRKMLEGYPAAAVILRDMLSERLDSWTRELGVVKNAMEKGGD
jgi:CRP-like cAMP-binding protein